jgi:hypothetical protein
VIDFATVLSRSLASMIALDKLTTVLAKEAIVLCRQIPTVFTFTLFTFLCLVLCTDLTVEIVGVLTEVIDLIEWLFDRREGRR